MNFYEQCAITAALFFIPIRLFSTNRIPPAVFYTYFSVLLLFALVLPLVFYFSLFLQRGVLYFYFLDRPEEGTLQSPEKFGLLNTRNFYIENENIRLGVWHILPTAVANPTNQDFDEYLKNGPPIILYIHGNLGSRATEHRLVLYKAIQELGYQIITFDYRCFGDSTYSTPHEKVIVSDCVAVAKWVISKSASTPIFLYGHSLGAGMTTNVAAQLERGGYETKGVILEAPFDNMPSEIKVHPFGTVFRIFPWYNFFFSSPYETNGEDFLSSEYILQFSSPIMILHAEDDGIIPSILGQKLYREGQQRRSKGTGPMSIFLFSADRGFGHADLCKAPETPKLIRDFIEKYKNEEFSTTPKYINP